ncbi:hypothetical protein KR009_003918, partial [Drosophila setifemur]
KRLQSKAHKKKLERDYVAKLLSSIKKKYNVQKHSHIKRKLDFRKNSPTKNGVLPKPKFYRPQKNDTIEDGEIVEELLSSDDDDCVLVESPKVTINLDEDEGRNKKEGSSENRNNVLKTGFIFEDSHRETALIRKPKSENALLYSTILKSESADISCVILDDSESIPKPIQLPKDDNDSVIIVEDPIEGEDFIPLPSDEPKVKIDRKRRSSTGAGPSRKVNRRMNDSLFTTAEKKQLGDYNRNTYNPEETTGDTNSTAKSNKRSIIIDGSNVAFAHGRSNVFSSEGIKYCIQYFDKIGHNVKAVIPLFRKNATKSSNPELLDQLYKEGKIVFTPCKNIPGQMSTSYDDRFILQLAYEWNAAVVSNDNYRDLINENPAFKKIVESRVLGYSWCDNIFLLPKDPYGRWGPTLDEILRC